MSGNARVAQSDSALSELEIWAERLHHLSVNSMLAAMTPGEDREKLLTLGDAYGNVAEWLWRRIEEIRQESAQA
jgi:hypothetical protein